MKLRFLEKQREVDGIWSFFFEPVDKIEWQAGQSIRLEIPRTTWGVDERRFTIASAPFEKNIQITTKVGESSFKQGLDHLILGGEIQGYNIEGDFLWQDDNKPRLFIAGGIGITPFRSLLAQAAHDKKPLNTTLIYGARESSALFQQQIDAWQKADPSLYVHYLGNSRLEMQHDASLANFWLNCNIYVSGPESMVQDIAKGLLDKGLPKNQLITDLFTGL